MERPWAKAGPWAIGAWVASARAIDAQVNPWADAQTNPLIVAWVNPLRDHRPMVHGLSMYKVGLWRDHRLMPMHGLLMNASSMHELIHGLVYGFMVHRPSMHGPTVNGSSMHGPSMNGSSMLELVHGETMG